MKKENILRFFLFLLSWFLSVMVTEAKPCNRCGGSGRMRMFESRMANYGLSSDKVQCRICKQWFINGSAHTEKCDVCGGSGQIGDSYSGSSSSSRVTDAEVYMTAAERNQIEIIKNLLKGRYEMVPCDACKGSGLCPVCKGFGFTAPGNSCVSCYLGGTGKCLLCYGYGKTKKKVMPSPEERDRLMKMLVEISAKGAERAQNHISPYSGRSLTTPTTTPQVTVTRQTPAPQVTRQVPSSSTITQRTEALKPSQLSSASQNFSRQQQPSTSSAYTAQVNNEELQRQAAERLLESFKKISPETTHPAPSNWLLSIFGFVLDNIFTIIIGVIIFCGVYVFIDETL